MSWFWLCPAGETFYSIQTWCCYTLSLKDAYKTILNYYPKLTSGEKIINFLTNFDKCGYSSELADHWVSPSIWIDSNSLHIVVHSSCNLFSWLQRWVFVFIWLLVKTIPKGLVRFTSHMRISFMSSFIGRLRRQRKDIWPPDIHYLLSDQTTIHLGHVPEMHFCILYLIFLIMLGMI